MNGGAPLNVTLKVGSPQLESMMVSVLAGSNRPPEGGKQSPLFRELKQVFGGSQEEGATLTGAWPGQTEVQT
eukprot:1076600-Amphidinium_carterae.1